MFVCVLSPKVKNFQKSLENLFSNSHKSQNYKQYYVYAKAQICNISIVLGAVQTQCVYPVNIFSERQ